MRPILFLVLISSLFNAGCALTGDMLADSRDSGVIGERKTMVAKPTSGFAVNGGFVYTPKSGESLVTPVVTGDEALFGGETDGWLRLRYGFRFACVGWRYNITAYWLNPDTKEYSGWLVKLTSPDKKREISTRIVDSALSSSFSPPLTAQQIQEEAAAQDKVDRDDQKMEAKGILIGQRTRVPYKDPLSPEERIRAEREVIAGLLQGGIEGYRLADEKTVIYTTSKIAQKEFVRAEADLCKGALKKKVVVWALNIYGYRLKDAPDERRAETWVCELVSDPANSADLCSKAGEVLETLRFSAKHDYAYEDLGDSSTAK